MQNFIAQSMRRMGLAPSNKVTPTTPTGSRSGGGQAPLAHMEVGSKWSYSSLEYPMDIQSRTDMGHYMMFYVNVANDTSYGKYNSVGKDNLTENKKGETILPTQTEAQAAVLEGQGFSEKQQGTAPSDISGKSWKPGFKPKVIERKPHQGTASDATGVKRTHRTNDAIVLYMPGQVTTSYAADYKDTDLGANIGEALGRASRADMTSAAGIAQFVKGMAGMAMESVERSAGATASAWRPRRTGRPSRSPTSTATARTASCCTRTSTRCRPSTGVDE